MGVVVHGAGWAADPLCVQSARPVGASMKVTAVAKAQTSNGREVALVAQLDGEPAAKRLQAEMKMDAFSAQALNSPLLGYAAPGSSGFASRHFNVVPGNGLLVVHGVDLEEDGEVQLQVLDRSWGAESLGAALAARGRADGDAMLLSETTDEPLCSLATSNTAGLVFACVGTARHEAAAFAEHCPAVAVSGGYMMGEVGSAAAGNRPYVLGYTSSCVLLRRVPSAAA